METNKKFKYTTSNKRYHTWDYHLKSIFGEKIIKISLDGGFTCPNIDGKVAYGGCIYCSKRGSGDFAGSSNIGDSLKNQYEYQKQLMQNKWPKVKKYIAYFQSFTNTYDTLENLKDKYETVLKFENIIGLSIATRPDCLPEDVLDYLSELNKKTYLWVELGLQTSNDKTGKSINRGHDFEIFLDAVGKLTKRNIKVCVHVINGLPGETKEDMLKTIHDIKDIGISGVKIHLLHVMKNTPVENYLAQNKMELLTQDEYTSIVVQQLELLPQNIIIQRLTGDAPKDMLIGPFWSLNKKSVLNEIDKKMLEYDTYQGIKH